LVFDKKFNFYNKGMFFECDGIFHFGRWMNG
jgi:hypothetical protein